MPIITLTEEEMLKCAMLGAKTQIYNILHKARGTYGSESEAQWQMHIESRMSEQAVAKLLYLPYDGGTIGEYKHKDVAGLYQVRCTKYPDGKLRLIHEDKDEDIFIHVTGIYGTYNIKKWCYGRDGKQEQWLSDPTNSGRPKAFFVPEKFLNDLETLPLPALAM